MRLFLAATVVLFALACGGSMTIEEAGERCAEGQAKGCLKLAEMFEPAPGQRAEHPDLFAVYAEASCDAGLSDYCYEIGFIRLTGRGGAQDQAAAAGFLQKGCEAGSGRACFTAGKQLRNADGVEKDGPKALELLEKACETSTKFDACAEVGQMWTTDEAGGPDMDKAKAFYAKACDAEPNHAFCRKK